METPPHWSSLMFVQGCSTEGFSKASIGKNSSINEPRIAPGFIRMFQHVWHSHLWRCVCGMRTAWRLDLRFAVRNGLVRHLDICHSLQFALQSSNSDSSVSENQITDKVVLTSWCCPGYLLSRSKCGMVAFQNMILCALCYAKHSGNWPCRLPKPGVWDLE